MATHHARPNEIVDLKTWAQDMGSEKNKAVMRTKELEVARLVIPAGKEFREHQVSGPITVHCVEGSISFTALGVTQDLTAGQLLYLEPDEPHSLIGITDAVVLLTIIFKQ
jgi:quercetin dioxygenase-like cupin family protein